MWFFGFVFDVFCFLLICYGFVVVFFLFCFRCLFVCCFSFNKIFVFDLFEYVWLFYFNMFVFTMFVYLFVVFVYFHCVWYFVGICRFFCWVHFYYIFYVCFFCWNCFFVFLESLDWFVAFSFWLFEFFFDFWVATFRSSPVRNSPGFFSDLFFLGQRIWKVRHSWDSLPANHKTPITVNQFMANQY